MVTGWKAYLSVSENAAHRCAGDESLRRAYRPLREAIRNVVEAAWPKTVACLGAGVLNDIPYRALVQSDATLHLVDWLPGLIETGITHGIIRADADDRPECIYCRLDDDRARAYCAQFERASPEADICRHFARGPKGAVLCTAFKRGAEPKIHGEDATAGYASAFATALADELPRANSWKQAFGAAIALSRRIGRRRRPLDIADHSIDLVTSSMLLSQFETQPYNYFAEQAATLLGRPRRRDERRLDAAMKTLRTTLLTNQVASHCQEIERILAPGGRCFMAFELFHYDRERECWFLVGQMHQALAIVAERFEFDFDLLPATDLALRFEPPGKSSLVYAFVLKAKGEAPSPPPGEGVSSRKLSEMIARRRS